MPQYFKYINNNDPNKHKSKSKGERTMTRAYGIIVQRRSEWLFKAQARIKAYTKLKTGI